jgi:aminopeptidase N
MVGRAAPACVLPNPGDVAYAQFVPDPVSREWLLRHSPDEPDPLARAVMVSALFESVRARELDPARFGETALVLLARERDPDTHAWLLDAQGLCLLRYLDDARAAPLRAATTELLLRQITGESGSGRELQTFRFLARTSTHPAVLNLCRAVAGEQPLPAGLSPGKQDRFLAAAALIAAGVADGEIERLQTRFANADVGREAFMALAATPTAQSKQAYWQHYLQLDAPPEQWTQDSLAWFHWPGQEALTLPFLKPALERVDWVKQNRRIFFMPAWLDGFINGHSSAGALKIARDFAANAQLSDDVRRKLAQSMDGLERAVAIRAAWSR